MMISIPLSLSLCYVFNRRKRTHTVNYRNTKAIRTLQFMWEPRKICRSTTNPVVANVAIIHRSLSLSLSASVSSWPCFTSTAEGVATGQKEVIDLCSSRRNSAGLLATSTEYFIRIHRSHVAVCFGRLYIGRCKTLVASLVFFFVTSHLERSDARPLHSCRRQRRSHFGCKSSERKRGMVKESACARLQRHSRRHRSGACWLLNIS